MQGFLYLQTAFQVVGEGFDIGHKSPDIEDFPHAVLCGRARKVVGTEQVHVAEMAVCQAGGGKHAVDQIDRSIRALQGTVGFAQGK